VQEQISGGGGGRAWGKSLSGAPHYLGYVERQVNMDYFLRRGDSFSATLKQLSYGIMQ
jgi:hypothetical protein